MNRSIAETVAAILSQSGYAAMTAYDGQEAMEIALLTPPELLITDVSLPGMSGIELAITSPTHISRLQDSTVLRPRGHSRTVGGCAARRAHIYAAVEARASEGTFGMSVGKPEACEQRHCLAARHSCGRASREQFIRGGPVMESGPTGHVWFSGELAALKKNSRTIRSIGDCI